MTLDLPSSFEDTIEADREWADSLIGKKSKRKEKANGKHKRKKEEEDDDGVVVVTDLRPLADRLHEKLEQAAAARKRKSIDPSDPPAPKKQRSEKKTHKKNKSKHENGISTTTTTTTSNKYNKPKLAKQEESDDDLLVEENEVIHVDDYYNELTNKVLNSSYTAPKLSTDDSEYEEEIRLRLLGLKKPEPIMSPEFAEDIQYGTFDFSSGQAIPQYLAKSKRNTTKRLEYLIKKAERKQKVKSGNTDKAEQLKWAQAEKKVAGDSNLDDVTRLKKKLKGKLKKKEKSRKDWAKRVEDSRAQIEKRQQKRKENIAAKVAAIKEKRINKRFGIKTKKKKGSKRRPGFEGKKQNFLNK